MSPKTKSTKNNGFTRRQFLSTAATGTVALALPWQIWANDTADTSLIFVQGGTSSTRWNTAIKALGGLEQFSLKGKNVVVKPNIGWDRIPSQAANTDPDLVSAVVKALVSADSKVSVFDSTCNTAQRCYRRSGIEEASKNAGAEVFYTHKKLFKDMKIPNGVKLDSWPIFSNYLNADFRINMPVLKHHSLAGISMGLKNLMGIMGESRPSIHNDFDQKLIDIVEPILPDLSVIDARRVLRRNGPQGGNLDDVEIMDSLIVGFDPVAVDAEGARLFGTSPYDLGYLVEAEKRGLGSIERPANFQQVNLNI